MGRWAKFFELLAGEDIDGNQMNLSVTMFASLRGGHIDNLARTVLDADETILPQGRALHGVSCRRAGICRFERMFMLLRHSDQLHVFLVCMRPTCGGGGIVRGDLEKFGILT